MAATGTGSEDRDTRTYRAPEGMCLIFVPLDERVYELVLSNRTRHSFLFEVEPRAGRRSVRTERGVISAGSQTVVGEMDLDQLNDSPSWALAFWRKRSDGGTDRPWRKEIKLKASRFFQRLAKWDRATGDGLAFDLFGDLPPQAEAIKVDTPDAPRKRERFTDSPWRAYEHLPDNALAKAMLSNEIDLHAEKLVRHPERYSAAELKKMQLKACRDYLEKAIVFHLPRVYLIHGMGDGVLRNEIARMLDEMADVVRYSNEYHPRYGYGATEVLLTEG